MLPLAETFRPKSDRPAVHGTRVLLVEDDLALSRGLTKMMERRGLTVVHAPTGGVAIELLVREAFDVVLSDVTLPEVSGLDLVRMIRAYGIDVPVVLMTGDPSLDTQNAAHDLGVLRYLRKPLSGESLVSALEAGFAVGTDKRSTIRPRVESDLSARFDSALGGLFVMLQPISDTKERRLLGYESFVRSHEPSLGKPADLFAAAEQLGRTKELCAKSRELAVESFMRIQNRGALRLFVNVGVEDLADEALCAEGTLMAEHADRIVLEIGDSGAIGSIEEIRHRTSILRFFGYEVALANIGAGFPGLDGLVEVEPDVVKLAMGLIRGIEDSRARQEVVRSLVRLSEELHFKLIAEGVENESELATLKKVGVRYMQGYYIGAPSASIVPSRAVR